MRTSILGVLTMALLAGACRDSTGIEEEGLTPAEALAIAGELARSGEVAFTESSDGASADVLADGLGAISMRIEHASTHPCPLGGSAALTFSVGLELDGEAESFKYDADGTLAHDACAFEEEGVSLTVTGDPELVFLARLTAIRGNAGPYIASFNGALNWTADDGREGRCIIVLDAITDFLARERVVAGEICGHGISQTINWN